VGVGVSDGLGELSGVASDLGSSAGLGFVLLGVAVPVGDGKGDVSLGGVGLASC
jgi:hypothetical protein